MAVDYTNDKVELQPTDYAVGIFETIKKLNSDLKNVGDKHNSLTDDVQNSINDLQEQIDNISGGDLEEINEKIKKLKNLLGEDDTANEFLDVIDVVNSLVEELNKVKKNDTFEYLFNSETGELTVDLTNYGFTSVDDYKLLVTLNDFKPVLLNVQKVDEKTSKVVARDLRHFMELNVKYTDAGVKDADGNFTNAFPVTILVSYDKNVVNEKVGREPTER